MPSQRTITLGCTVKPGKSTGSSSVSLFRLKCISSVLEWLKGAYYLVASWKSFITISFSSLQFFRTKPEATKILKSSI